VTKLAIENAIRRWTAEVWSKQLLIDPHDGADWFSMAVGFMIGIGLGPEDAEIMANELSDRRLL
jgi:hypothetical protein